MSEPRLDLDAIERHYLGTITQEWPPYTRELLTEVRLLRETVETIFAAARLRTTQRDELLVALADLVACVNAGEGSRGAPAFKRAQSLLARHLNATQRNE